MGSVILEIVVTIFFVETVFFFFHLSNRYL